jgi:hypothetical protein
MRWKLVLITSLTASIVGAGGSIAILIGILGRGNRVFAPDLIVLATLILPLAAITGAAIFVYRHTARRRKLQAMTTVLLAVAMTLLVFIISSIIFSKSISEPLLQQPTIG